MPVKSQTARIFAAGETMESTIQECSCGTRLDVSRYEPLQTIACPSCGRSIAVQGTIDRFALEAIAGKGGMGVVYQAYDPHLGRKVALKVVRQDKATDEVLQQMAAEAGVTASINHPHVVRVYSVGNCRGRVFIAMEIIRGGSLDELLLKHKTLPETQVLDMAIQVASGLEAAQRAGLVHRDIKPGNILFADPKTAKVVDFGLALFERSAVSANEIWGTPYYMPPERLQGLAEDFRSDIYALGTTLFHALTGRPPFEAADGTAVALKRLHAPAPSVLTYAPAVSNATAFVLKKMMEREPEARFQSYQELIDSLQFARHEAGSRPGVKARVVLNSSGESSSGMWVTLALIGVLVAACVAGFFFLRKTAAPETASKPPPVIEEAVVNPPPEPPKAAPARVEAPKPEIVKKPAVPEPAKSEPAKPAKVATFGTALAPAPGVYVLLNRAGGKALESPGAVMTDGAELLAGTSTKAYHQRWMIKNNPDGSSRLLAFHHGKALDVRGGSADDGALISTSAPKADLRQRWRLRQIEPGWVALVAECSGKALTVVAGPSPGAGKIGQREYDGKPEQQWRLESVESLPPGIDLLDPVLTPAMPSPPPVTARVSPGANPRFVPLDMTAAANADSRRGLYSNADEKHVSPRPKLRGAVEVAGVPFVILDPERTSTGKDNVTLRGGHGQSKGYVVKVEIPVGKIPLARVHVVGGVSGWAYPYRPEVSPLGALAARMTVVFQDGTSEAILLRSGDEFMDHQDPGAVGVPGSARIEGFASPGRQLRYFAKTIRGTGPVQSITIESFDNHLAPTFFALTGEKR